MTSTLDQALDLLSSEDYDMATIYKKDQNIQKIELDKHFEGQESDHDISEGYENVDIIKKRRNGKIVTKKRKVIKELVP